MAIGALTGLLVSLALKLKIRGIFKDGLLGSFGFLLGWIGAVFMPWPRNTIAYYVDGVLVTSTMNSYQHPVRLGFVVAVLLSLLHTLYRFKRSKGFAKHASDHETTNRVMPD
jgi:hypothetical protein